MRTRGGQSASHTTSSNHCSKNSGSSKSLLIIGSDSRGKVDGEQYTGEIGKTPCEGRILQVRKEAPRCGQGAGSHATSAVAQIAVGRKRLDAASALHHHPFRRCRLLHGPTMPLGKAVEATLDRRRPENPGLPDEMSYLSARGRRTVKTLPSPGTLSALITPSICSTKARAIARPNPEPLRPRARSVR